MNRMIAAGLCALASALSATVAYAQVTVSGTFTAEMTCEATKKLNSDNPGAVETQPGETYEVVGVNKTEFTHYLIVVADAPVTQRRWVARGCGTVSPELVLGNGSGGAGGGPVTGQGLAPDSIENVLAASWQPGFCVTNRGQSKTECQSQTAARPDARQFSIHGLWPDDLDNKEIFPCFCDDGPPASCRGRRDGPDSIDLDDDLRARLAVAMPGTQSGLDAYEWHKHGTCYEDDLSTASAGADPDEYFADTLHLLDQLNGSGVRELFEDNLGQVLSASAVEAAFDDAFGPGAGRRVLMRCNDDIGERVITELWIGLAGEIDETSDLGALILTAPDRSVSTSQTTCASGLVVEVQ